MSSSWLRKSYWTAVALLSAATLLISCQTNSGKSGVAFTPDISASANKSEMSVEQQVQQRELEGYVAQTSSRRFMRLPKDLDLALSGALKTPKKVEFIEPEVEYQSHMSPYRLTDFVREARYRPVFNDRFNVSPSIR